MISIIICSKHPDISEQLKLNIQSTIGVLYELIVIDNSNNEYSIFKAYNEGIKRASYNFLCFMHEDIQYHSPNWGKCIIEHLSNPKIGLIGLSGSFYLLPIPSTWFKAKPYIKNHIQTSANSKKPSKHYSVTENKEVVCVDGFWFCSRKDVFEHVTFDEKSFDNFHFYDLDISMQIHRKKYVIKAISAVTVEHFSGGTLNAQWLVSAYAFLNKWQKQLPASINVPFKKRPFTNVKAFRDLLYIHRKNNCKVSKETLKIGWRTLRLNILTAYLLFYIKLLHH